MKDVREKQMNAESEKMVDKSHGAKKRTKGQKKRSKGPDGVSVTDESGSDQSEGDIGVAKVEQADYNTSVKLE